MKYELRSIVKHQFTYRVSDESDLWHYRLI